MDIHIGGHTNTTYLRGIHTGGHTNTMFFMGKGPPKFPDLGGCAGKAIFKLKLRLLLHVFGLGASSGRFGVFWGVPILMVIFQKARVLLV